MRNNYLNLSNNNFPEALQLGDGLRKLFLFLGFILLSLNSFGQNNAADPIPFVTANFPNLTVSKSTTATLCIGCGISNENNLIDNSLTNFATASTGVLSVGVVNTLRVTDGTLNKTYVAGSFAGFKIGTGSQVLSLDLLNGITIKTYLDGVFQESNSGNALLNLSLLSGTNESMVGFNTLKPFDAIEIVLNGTVSLLSATNVYYAVVKQYYAGPALECNTATKLSFPTSPVTIDPANTGFTGLLSLGSVTNVNNAVSADNDDYATINFTLGALADASIAVKDQVTDYPAGTFAGFEIQNTGVLNVSALGNIVVSTYLNGLPVESFSANNLVANVSLLSSASRFKLGFVSNQAFDEVKLTISGAVNLGLGTTRVYGAVFEKFCAGPALACNTVTKLSAPTFPVFINSANSGFSGVLSLGSIANIDNVISTSNSDYASIDFTVGALSDGSIAVKDQVTDYPAGTYAGFEIENTNLLSVSTIGNVVVSTYLNGAPVESFSGNNLLANVSLLSSAGRFKVGFVTTQAFDEVKITINQTVGVTLGTTKVYAAVFEKFCAGPALQCNTQTALTAPTYPVYVNGVNTGYTGLVCVGCTVVNQDNLIDADLTNYAELNLAVGVGNTASLSVKDQITDYPAGTFAAYTIENPALLTVDALNSIKITTYLNGVAQETKAGNTGALVSVGTDLLVGKSKQTIGFVSTMPFDEVQITFENVLAVNLGIVKVYNAVFQKLCNPVVECNKTYVWSNPAFPVTIDGDKTGIDGVACLACAVSGTDNLLTASETDFANIKVVAGVLASGSVAVKDQLFTYPKGTFAGYVIKDLGTLAQVNLLQSLNISTYNNGVLQETKSAGQLIDLSLLGLDVLGSVPGVYNVGFKATLPFDEIKLTLNSVASVINNINVYGAFVDTSESDGGSGSGLECNSSSISVAKDGVYFDANSDGIVNVGDRINYTFVIKNTGFETVTNVSLTDNNATVSGAPIASLAVGATNTSYTATHTITQADIDAGVVYNLATATARTPFGTTITATSTDPTPCTTCPVNPSCATCTATIVPQTNSIALAKTASVSGTAVLGKVITYTFTVKNTGNTTLHNIVVTDPMVGLTISGSPIVTLAPGATNTSITGTYVITQADVDAGKVTNSALVTAKDPQNNDITDVSGTSLTTNDDTVIPVAQTPAIALVKTATVGGAGALNDVVTYTFAVTNTGTTTLHDIVVTDPMVGLTFVSGNTIATLAPGTTNLSITATYIITQADVNAGKVTNSALVNAKDPQNNPVSDISGTTIITDDSTETPIGQRSTIALVKKVVASATRNLNDIITYVFEVHNTGTTDLHNITVTDPLIGLNSTNNLITTLAAGAIDDTTITRTYTITQADVDAGKVTNSAVVNGLDPLNNPVTDISGTTVGTNDNTVTPVTQTSSVALVKTASVGGTGVLGDVITYTFAVHNTGTTTLKNIVVTDPMVGLTIVGNPIASLAPGVTNSSITGVYVIKQADIIAGNVTNSALVTATPPQGANVTDKSGATITTDGATVTPVTQKPSISITKEGTYVDANNDGITNFGDRIDYSFVVTNTGESSLSNVMVTDSKVAVFGGPITLAYNTSNSTAFTATYNISQADIDAGVVYNLATVTANPPVGVAITAISTDPTPCTTCPVDEDCLTCTITKLTQNPKIALQKTAIIGGTGTGLLNEVITYTFTVKNTGNTTLKNVIVTDPMVGLTITGSPIVSLAPGATNSTIKGTYTIKQGDIDAGKVINSALVTAQDPQNNNITDKSGKTLITDDPTDTPVVPKSATIALKKIGVIGGTGTGLLNEVITYTFTVKNTGNVTLSNVIVTDPMVGLTILGNPIASLAPGETNTTITGKYTINQTNIDAGKVSNQATVTAKDPQGVNVTDLSGTELTTNDVTNTPLTQNSSIALVKLSSVPTFMAAGGVVTYTFTVHNTGNTTIKNIVVTDPLPDLIMSTSTIASLAPGNSDNSITATYVVKQADVELGKVVNQAKAVGIDPNGDEVMDISGTTITGIDVTVTPIDPMPAITLTKDGVYYDTNGDGVASIGDKVKYTFVIKNTGNTILYNINLTDENANVSVQGATVASLIPKATLTDAFTAEYLITQDDINAGVVYNLATVSAKTSLDVSVTADSVDPTPCTTCPVNTDCPSCTITGLPQSPKIALMLTGEFQDEINDGQAEIGETIKYTYTIMNMGNVPLSNVYISNPMVGLDMNSGMINMPIGAMDSTTFTATYTLTQADIIAKNVTNQATVFGTSPLGVVVQDLSDDDSPLEDDGTVIGVEGCTLKVFNAVSPNVGSDYERILYIRGMDCYPNNSVQIFDRWGVKVYDVDGYNNDAKAFRGVSDGRATVSQSKSLPTGTYFYVIKYVDEDGKGYNKAGYLHLIND